MIRFISYHNANTSEISAKLQDLIQKIPKGSVYINHDIVLYQTVNNVNKAEEVTTHYYTIILTYSDVNYTL